MPPGRARRTAHARPRPLQQAAPTRARAACRPPLNRQPPACLATLSRPILNRPPRRLARMCAHARRPPACATHIPRSTPVAVRCAGCGPQQKLLHCCSGLRPTHRREPLNRFGSKQDASFAPAYGRLGGTDVLAVPPAPCIQLGACSIGPILFDLLVLYLRSLIPSEANQEPSGQRRPACVPQRTVLPVQYARASKPTSKAAQQRCLHPSTRVCWGGTPQPGPNCVSTHQVRARMHPRIHLGNQWSVKGWFRPSPNQPAPQTSTVH
jgi:hypothetical protein